MSLYEVYSQFMVMLRRCFQKLLVGTFEPIGIVLPWIGVGKMVKADWISFFQHTCHVILWNSLMKPVTVSHRNSQLVQAKSEMNVIVALRTWTFAKRIFRIGHLLNQFG